jgi:hypothetical protein
VARIKEALILEEVGFADERLASGLFSFTFRSLMYLFAGGLLSFKLITSYTAGGIALGAAVLLFALAFAFYPVKSVRLEAILVQALFFYLSPGLRPGGANKTDAQRDPSENPPSTQGPDPRSEPGFNRTYGFFAGEEGDPR